MSGEWCVKFDRKIKRMETEKPACNDKPDVVG